MQCCDTGQQIVHEPGTVLEWADEAGALPAGMARPGGLMFVRRTCRRRRTEGAADQRAGAEFGCRCVYNVGERNCIVPRERFIRTDSNADATVDTGDQLERK